MGTPVAVAFANIYLTMLEIAINEQLQLIPNYTPPLYYKRFIDDLIAFFKDTFSATSFSIPGYFIQLQKILHIIRHPHYYSTHTQR